jgi:hypothetical protein
MMILEGVHYEIDWRGFKKGTSLFFPCLDPERARETLYATTERIGIKVLTKVVIEDKIMGLRVWRM